LGVLARNGRANYVEGVKDDRWSERRPRQCKTVASNTPKALKRIAQGQRRPEGARATLGKGEKGGYPEGVEDEVVSVFRFSS